MRLARNLIAGLANSVWSALVGLAVVPFYLRYLGIEAYGLIGFFVTVQALLQFLDMGLAPTINREVARYSASGDLKETGSLLHTLAVVYWGIAAAIALLLTALSPVIAEYWLQSKELAHESVSHAVLLMGLVIACRWPVSLYQGVLIGAQRIVVSSTIGIMMVTVGNFGAVAVLAFVSPTIEAFFVWQAAVSLVYTATVQWAAWRVIGPLKHRRFSVVELKRIWRFSAGMSGIAVSGLVFTQLDKVILSRTLGLGEFGHYMLATVVMSGMYLLVTPMFNVLYPRLSALVVSSNTERLTDLYRLGTRMFAVVLFPTAMLLAVFPESLVEIWTGDPDVAAIVSPVISLLVVGTALNGVMFLPYALQLAYGMTWIPLTLNIVLMCLMVPLVALLAHAYGAIGGGMAWVTVEVVYMVLGTALTHRHLLRGLGARWLFQDIGIPLAVAILTGLVGRYVIQRLDISVHEELMLGAGFAMFSSALILALSPQLRAAIWRYMGWKAYATEL